MLPLLLNTFATTAANCQVGTFFGLVPWYGYLPNNDFNSDCSLSNFQVIPSAGQASDIPLVLLAVVDDLLRVAGLVAVGFIIFGAVQYMTSQGDSNQTAKAQGTIINALVGLAIALIAVVFVSYLGSSLSH